MSNTVHVVLLCGYVLCIYFHSMLDLLAHFLPEFECVLIVSMVWICEVYYIAVFQCVCDTPTVLLCFSYLSAVSQWNNHILPALPRKMLNVYGAKQNPALFWLGAYKAIIPWVIRAAHWKKTTNLIHLSFTVSFSQEQTWKYGNKLESFCSPKRPLSNGVGLSKKNMWNYSCF